VTISAGVPRQRLLFLITISFRLGSTAACSGHAIKDIRGHHAFTTERALICGGAPRLVLDKKN
jgi:hypothetical protein